MMFKYIKRKINKAVEREMKELRWDTLMKKAADTAVNNEIKWGYKQVSKRVDNKIAAIIKPEVSKELTSQINNPNFVKEVVAQLNAMQVKSSQSKK